VRIDFSTLAKAINEFFTVKTMTTAERFLIRQEKDLYNYLAIHIASIIKSLLVFALLFILIQYPTFIPIDIFWIYLFTGLFFLIIDPLGFRALIFLLTKFIKQLYGFIKDVYRISVEVYFKKTQFNAQKYKLVPKIFYWFISIMFFVFPLIIILLKLLLIASLYALVFLSITILGNEAFSLILMNSLRFIVPLNYEIVQYIYYILSFSIIYFIVDYRIRQTDEVLVLDETLEDGIKRIEGLTLINSNDKISIYVEDEKYLVFNHGNNMLMFYRVNSKYIKRRQALEQWIRSRSTKKIKKSV
jgi:hypothetical protein